MTREFFRYHAAVAAHGADNAEDGGGHRTDQYIRPVGDNAVDRIDGRYGAAFHFCDHMIQLWIELAAMVDHHAGRTRRGRLRKPAPLQVIRKSWIVFYRLQLALPVAVEGVLYHGTGLEHLHVAFDYNRDFAKWVHCPPFQPRAILG